MGVSPVIKQTLCLGYMVFFVLNAETMAQENACLDYTTISDPTRSVLHIIGDSDQPLCDTTIGFGWFRYNYTSDGAMATSCPNDKACGTTEQVWIDDDMHPPLEHVEVMTESCIHINGECCAIRGGVRAMNCSTFLVYFLTTLAADCRRYCFDEKATSTSTAINKDTDEMTTSTTAVNQDAAEVTSDNTKTILAITFGSIIGVAIIIVLLVLLVWKYICKKPNGLLADLRNIHRIMPSDNS